MKITDKGLMTEEDIAREFKPGKVITGRKLTIDDIYIPPQPEEKEDDKPDSSDS